MSNSATNPLSNSIVVSSATLTNQTNPNTKTTTKKSNIPSIAIGPKCGATKKIPSKVSTSGSVNEIKNSLNSVLSGNKGVNKCVNTGQNPTTMNGYKSMNGTITNHLNNNNNNETKPVLSSDSFKRRLGTNPISPYKNPDFLKCEYDLLRSQVISSRSRSACGEKNNNNNNNNQNSNANKTNGHTSTSLTSSPAKDSNRNKVTIFGVNSTSPSITTSNLNSTLSGTAIKAVDKNARATDNHSIDKNSNENMSINCAQHGVDHLDDIKYIDSDDSERRNSPNTMNVATLKEFFNDNNMALGKSIKQTSTLPTNTGASKKLNDLYSNKYNTITNGSSCGHQANAHFGNGIARKAVPEEMLSSTSSSTSTLSAMTESSTSSLLPKNAAKENGTSIKLNHYDGGDAVSVSACDGTIPSTIKTLLT